MDRQCIALITARGGSKGLPRKNILCVNGKPLIEWTIRAAQTCSLIDRVFVSTEDEEISAISSELGAEIIVRPKELATDTASSVDVILHAIDWFAQQGIVSEDLVLLQPTSPLRTSRHLDEALTLYREKSAQAVISVFEPAHTPIKSYIECQDGSIQGLFSEEAPYMRRQDLPRAFLPNGAIYAFSIEEFNRGKHFPRDEVFPYLMSEKDSLDIDESADLIAVEKRMKELNV